MPTSHLPSRQQQADTNTAGKGIKSYNTVANATHCSIYTAVQGVQPLWWKPYKHFHFNLFSVAISHFLKPLTLERMLTLLSYVFEFLQESNGKARYRSAEAECLQGSRDHRRGTKDPWTANALPSVQAMETNMQCWITASSQAYGYSWSTTANCNEIMQKNQRRRHEVLDEISKSCVMTAGAKRRS